LPLDEMEICSLQILMSRKLLMSPVAFTVGGKVRLVKGPLAGAEGILLRTEPNKLIVSISLLRRSLSVEVPREWLESCALRTSSAAAPRGPLTGFCSEPA
jgi:transcription antitermination factor NusG